MLYKPWFPGCKTDEGLTCGAGVEAGVAEDWPGSSKLNQLERGSAWLLLVALVPPVLAIVPSPFPVQHVSSVKNEVPTAATRNSGVLLIKSPLLFFTITIYFKVRGLGYCDMLAVRA